MELFRTSHVWVVDYRYDGRPRRWFRTAAPGVDIAGQATTELQDTFGRRARLVAVRPATPDEEERYLRGEEPRNAYCPACTAKPG